MDYILTKEEFVKTINELKRVDDFYFQLDEVATKFAVDGYFVWPTSTDTAVTLLEKMFHDDSGWISYWCFELGYGEEYKEGTVVDNEGTIIPLGTAGQLYDLLIQNLEFYNNGAGGNES